MGCSTDAVRCVVCAIRLLPEYPATEPYPGEWLCGACAVWAGCAGAPIPLPRTSAPRLKS